MSFKKICKNSRNIHSDKLQLNLDYYSSPTWQYQDTNTKWEFGHLPQRVLSNLDLCHRMSDNLENCQFISDQISWEIKERIHNDLASNSIMSSTEQKNISIASFNTNKSNEACLIFRVPPENRFRYRYDTEMSGTHGSLQGIRTGREKSVPTVELINYPFEALIRITLVTCQENEHYPHPHSLFVKEKLYQKKIYENWDEKNLTKTGHYCDPHYIRVGRSKNDYIARFEGMCIINSKKENFHSSVKEKLQMRFLEYKHGIYGDDSLKADESENLTRSVETAVSAVDVDFVSLCFEAFREENGKLLPICNPIYSEAIGNAKSAKTGKLKISRINKCSGSCKGGDEIWLLVEKINKKGLVVRFSEEYDEKVLWESCIEGDDLILHHQYAIIFKTPPYKDVNIMTEVEVLMRLERATQPNQPSDFSEPITFVYEPSRAKTTKGENLCRKESILTPLKQLQTKRPRTESASISAFNHQCKRRPDDMEIEGMIFDDDIEQLLFDSKDSFELDQTWGKFNVEEFLRFISSDDIDMPMQRDGVAFSNKCRRDLFYKLYLLYSKLDENDIKKLTEQISNFRVSKKEASEGKSGMEKDQVKDAASTLLTLRSKAMINSNNSIINCQHNNNNNDIDDDLMMSTVFGENKSKFLERGSLHNQMFEPCCESESGVQSPVHMSVIKFNLAKSKFSNQNKPGKDFSDLESHCEERTSVDSHKYKMEEEKLSTTQTIQKEKNLPGNINLEKIFEILNRNASWQNLAELWNCSGVVTYAKKSSNPTKYIFEYIKKVQGELELKTLKNSLEAINEKEALDVLKTLLEDNFNLFNKNS